MSRFEIPSNAVFTLMIRNADPAEVSKRLAGVSQREKKFLADSERCTICKGTQYEPVPKGDKRCGCWDDSWGIKF